MCVKMVNKQILKTDFLAKHFDLYYTLKLKLL